MNVGRGAGVLVERDASVVATASSMGRLGAGVRLGNEQDVKISNVKSLNKSCLMGRLYNFSEQIDLVGVNEIRSEDEKSLTKYGLDHSGACRLFATGPGN